MQVQAGIDGIVTPKLADLIRGSVDSSRTFAEAIAGSVADREAARIMGLHVLVWELLYFYLLGAVVSVASGFLGVDSSCGYGPHGIRVAPSGFTLLQNIPNPFSETATITFSTPVDQPVRLSIYNMRGEEIARPVDGAQPGGWHTVAIDAVRLPMGVYYYRLAAGPFAEQRAMMILK